ncbi:2-oxoacid:acceptor oxidoreductase subunit alpha [Candidatus Bathyarchaeota archaeon]|nr:2-oxoacid:acceptor oxidoreductase subunit alpha [Candidatus Bathyarchaeota archaeon]
MRRDVLSGIYFVQGNIACAEGAVAAGCRFFAGYPITPATEICEHMAVRLPEVDGVFIQMEDEIASLAAVLGASYSGVKAMTATSGPGFSLMMENLGLAVMTETPCVLVNVMRGGPSTGQPTKTGQQDVMQARWGSHGDYELIVLAPASVQEMFDFTVEAFNLSEEYRTPVIILADEIVAHIREKLIIPEPNSIKKIERKKPKISPNDYLPFKPDESLIPPMACFGEGYHIYATGLTHDERGMPDMSAEAHQYLVRRLCDKIRNNADKIVKTQEFLTDDAEIAIITYGTTTRSALSAAKKARKEGIKVGIQRLITIWPLPERAISKLAEKVEVIIVPEMNYGQLVREIERVAKTTPVIHLPKLGEELHRPTEILEAIRRNLCG